MVSGKRRAVAERQHGDGAAIAAIGPGTEASRHKLARGAQGWGSWGSGTTVLDPVDPFLWGVGGKGLMAPHTRTGSSWTAMR